MSHFKVLIPIIAFIFLGCNSKNDEKLNCIEANQISFKFISPFNFLDDASIIIDNEKFLHTFYGDSIKSGNYLPKDSLLIFELRGKQEISKSNVISLGRALALKLKKTNNYKILNGPELLTTGVLKIARKDGQQIKVCITDYYPVKISEFINKP